jgi:hypothetical protein
MRSNEVVMLSSIHRVSHLSTCFEMFISLILAEQRRKWYKNDWILLLKFWCEKWMLPESSRRSFLYSYQSSKLHNGHRCPLDMSLSTGRYSVSAFYYFHNHALSQIIISFISLLNMYKCWQLFSCEELEKAIDALQLYSENNEIEER